MKTISNTIAIMLFLGLLFGIGWLGYITVTFLIGQFGVVDPQTSAILTISSVSFLLSAIIIAGAIKTLNVGGDKSIHPEKAEIYTRFVEMLEVEKQEELAMTNNLKKYMMIWASDLVLQEFASYLELMKNTDSQSSEIDEQAQKVIAAMRQDVSGGSTTNDITYIEKLLH